jgi:hypothetical protein
MLRAWPRDKALSPWARAFALMKHRLAFVSVARICFRM